MGGPMAVRMSMTEQEAAYEEFIDDLYRQWEAEYSQEIKNRGVEEYLGDLLKSYYLSNTQIAQIPLRRIREAESLLGTNASASLALGYSAIEIGFKNLILRPMVTGFIHETSVASLIAEIVVSRSNTGHFSKLLEVILPYVRVADRGMLTVAERQDTLWAHMERIKERRNVVLHRGEEATQEEANAALMIAKLIIEKIFPRLLENMGLKLEGEIISARSEKR
jgi:hypothetical protein